MAAESAPLSLAKTVISLWPTLAGPRQAQSTVAAAEAGKVSCRIGPRVAHHDDIWDELARPSENEFNVAELLTWRAQKLVLQPR